MKLIDNPPSRTFFDQKLFSSNTETGAFLPRILVEAPAKAKSSPAAGLATTAQKRMPMFSHFSSSSHINSGYVSTDICHAVVSPLNQSSDRDHPDQPIGTNHTGCYSQDANKAFDDVVFDILKVEPDCIAGQLTLIDLPLFKAIEPDELISCKWMSREKLVKAPNIVQFTRRFNQTTFWCQKEILTCKRIETRGKMITHFIKIAKRLNELHSFNSLMAIVVALKSAPIYRLKKTWSQHVSKKEASQLERLADLMFDTSDNKRKIRDMHMNCKLPCIPFLGHFLTDLIHIDIAHPHNSFDNPQRRNQMNNICRLISEYQQSNYQESSSLTCGCCGSGGMNGGGGGGGGDTDSGCSCSHQHHYGGGIINSDGTIFINEVTYVKNYLNSFLYIEELQKFKEDENYRDSLELEPDSSSASNTPSASDKESSSAKSNEALCLTPKFNNNDIFSPDYQFSFTAESTFTKTNSLHPTSNHRKSNSLVNPVTFPLFIDHNSHNNSEAKPDQKTDSGRIVINQPTNSVQLDHHDQTIKAKSFGRNLTKNLNELHHRDHAKSADDHIHKISNRLNYDSPQSSGGSFSSVGGHFDIGQQQLPASTLIFESPVKRKCIIKNFQKPRFNQWKSYWLQLVAGNVLIYYPTRSMFVRAGNADRNDHLPDPGGVSSSSDNSVYVDQQLLQLQQLQSQLQCKKVNYHKSPCKMHPIASWMVVNLFQDKENEMLTTATVTQTATGSYNSSSTAGQNYSKFDVQLNDLNNGNMYKYRFDNLPLAKEWYEQFKLASTYHERQKPDNLIRFD